MAIGDNIKPPLTFNTTTVTGDEGEKVIVRADPVLTLGPWLHRIVIVFDHGLAVDIPAGETFRFYTGE
jgi:hypothetical protein